MKKSKSLVPPHAGDTDQHLSYFFYLLQEKIRILPTDEPTTWGQSLSRFIGTTKRGLVGKKLNQSV